MDQAFAARHPGHAGLHNTAPNWWYVVYSLLQAHCISLSCYISPFPHAVIVYLKMAEGPFAITIAVTNGYPPPRSKTCIDWQCGILQGDAGLLHHCGVDRSRASSSRHLRTCGYGVPTGTGEGSDWRRGEGLHGGSCGGCGSG
jgi:hypothetical protein